MATPIVEGNNLADILIDEAPNMRSRAKKTVLSGQNLAIGAVIGLVTSGVGGAPVPVVSGTGNGTMSLVSAGPDVQVGSYVVTCTSAVTNGGVFSVVAPDGTALPSLTLTVGAGSTTAYTSSHINFSITDGSTDFAAADSFTIVVSSTAPVVIGTGDGTMSLITLGKEAQSGAYTVTCTAAATNGGTFSVRAPDGTALPDLVLSAGAGNTTAYTNPQINFSITDGSTDFVVGDVFNIFAYNELTSKAVAWDPTAVDGRQHVAGFLIAAVDASAADTDGVAIVRDAQVTEENLAWASSVSAAEKLVGMAELRALGIVDRDAA